MAAGAQRFGLHELGFEDGQRVYNVGQLADVPRQAIRYAVYKTRSAHPSCGNSKNAHHSYARRVFWKVGKCT